MTHRSRDRANDQISSVKILVTSNTRKYMQRDRGPMHASDAPDLRDMETGHLESGVTVLG